MGRLCLRASDQVVTLIRKKVLQLRSLLLEPSQRAFSTEKVIRQQLLVHNSHVVREVLEMQVAAKEPL